MSRTEQSFATITHFKSIQLNIHLWCWHVYFVTDFIILKYLVLWCVSAAIYRIRCWPWLTFMIPYIFVFVFCSCLTPKTGKYCKKKKKLLKSLVIINHSVVMESWREQKWGLTSWDSVTRRLLVADVERRALTVFDGVSGLDGNFYGNYLKTLVVLIYHLIYQLLLEAVKITRAQPLFHFPCKLSSYSRELLSHTLHKISVWIWTQGPELIKSVITLYFRNTKARGWGWCEGRLVV